jgi:hypothetical protein
MQPVFFGRFSLNGLMAMKATGMLCAPKLARACVHGIKIKQVTSESKSNAVAHLCLNLNEAPTSSSISLLLAHALTLMQHAFVALKRHVRRCKDLPFSLGKREKLQ